MPKPRVFLSHSAREDDRALATLEALDAALRGGGFEVLLDRKALQVGDAWENKLGGWLDRCEAAVVLLSTKSLRSDYVKFEVSNLLHRWQRQGGDAGPFKLLPVLVEPIPDTDLQGFYSVVNLWAVQRLGPVDDATLCATILARLAPLRAPAAPPSAARLLEGHVESILRNIPSDRFLLDTAAVLGFDTADWPAADVAPDLARALVTSSMSTGFAAVNQLQPQLSTKTLVWNLFDFLMPVWVGPESARALDEVTRRPPGTRCALLNARSVEFTPGMYMARATAQLPRLAATIVALRAADLGVNVEAGLHARVTEALEVALDVHDPMREFSTTLREQLKLRTDVHPVVVAVQLDVAAVPAVCRLAASPELELVTFLAFVRPSPPDPAVPGVAVLHPLIPERPDQPEDPANLERQASLRHRAYADNLKQAVGAR